MRKNNNFEQAYYEPEDQKEAGHLFLLGVDGSEDFLQTVACFREHCNASEVMYEPSAQALATLTEQSTFRMFQNDGTVFFDFQDQSFYGPESERLVDCISSELSVLSDAKRKAFNDDVAIGFGVTGAIIGGLALIGTAFCWRSSIARCCSSVVSSIFFCSEGNNSASPPAYHQVNNNQV